MEAKKQFLGFFFAMLVSSGVLHRFCVVFWSSTDRSLFDDLDQTHNRQKIPLFGVFLVRTHSVSAQPGAGRRHCGEGASEGRLHAVASARLVGTGVWNAGADALHEPRTRDESRLGRGVVHGAQL